MNYVNNFFINIKQRKQQKEGMSFSIKVHEDMVMCNRVTGVRDEQRKQQQQDMSFSVKFQKYMMCNRAKGVTRRTDGRI